jgi:REP element-mobilizing transposase RayT
MIARQRKIIRLRDYDYANPGEYFVTICTYNRECFLGDVREGEVKLTFMGEIAQQCWLDIPKHFSNVELDEYAIMPNHVHGIIIIKESGRDVQLNVPTRLSPRKGTISVIIRTYKAAVTTICRRNGWNYFRWQTRFYDRIIRSDKELENIRDYIVNNPMRWCTDEENPINLR